MESLEFNLFPTPANDKIIIKNNSGKEYSFFIYDLTGKLIFSHHNIVSLENTLFTDNLENGVYFVRIIPKSKKASSLKIIIQK